jgi:hypothetical protein
MCTPGPDVNSLLAAVRTTNRESSAVYDLDPLALRNWENYGKLQFIIGDF